MRRVLSLLIAGALVLTVGAGATALGSGGSAYVTSDCFYPSLQDNTIIQDDDVYVWIKFTGGNESVGQWSTVDNSGNNTQEGDLVYAECSRGDKYFLYWAEDFDSSVLGSYTLTAWQGDAYVSTAISGDGFRVVAAEE